MELTKPQIKKVRKLMEDFQARHLAELSDFINKYNKIIETTKES